MKRVFSGIQPSGEIHIGNYLGAIKMWVSLIDHYECFFCIVDYHAISIKYDIHLLQKKAWNAILDNIACGIDPEESKLFIQSHVPEHTELAWILNTITVMGDLERMTQYKDKSKQHKNNVNAALLNYPILQAADIIIYKSNYVPVGEDQLQHIELTRRIVRSFNHRFKKIFPEPKSSFEGINFGNNTKAIKVIGIDGKNKMSKSMNNYISLSESEESLKRKIQLAVTDTKRIRKSDKGNPNDCNVFSWHQFFTAETKIDEINESCRSAKIGCSDCKKILYNYLYEFLKPIQYKRSQLSNNLSEIKQVIYENGKSCQKIARETLDEVKEAMGLNYII